MIRSIERVTGVPTLQRLYDTLPEVSAEEIWQAALDQLEIDVSLSGEPLSSVPEEGPVLVIANHPFGVLDGLAIAALTARLRPRFRLVANSVMGRDERLGRTLLPIDFSETREAMRTNLETRRRAVELLRAGDAVAIFPAGGVATAKRGLGPAVDLEWKTFVAKLVQTPRATVLPLFFPGQNPRIFQIVSQFSLDLRLALLLGEAIRRRRSRLEIVVGRPIPFEELEPFRSRAELTAHLRRVVHALDPRADG